jgi:hypothetical protein
MGEKQRISVIAAYRFNFPGSKLHAYDDKVYSYAVTV